MLNKEYVKLLDKVLIMGMIYGLLIGGIIDLFNIDLSGTHFVNQLEAVFPAIQVLHVNNKHPALAISLWSVLLISIIPITFFSVLFFRERLIDRFSLLLMVIMFALFYSVIDTLFFGFRDTLPTESSPPNSQLIHLTKIGTIFYISLFMNCLVFITVIVFSMLIKVIRYK